MSTSPESHIQSLEEQAQNIQRSYHESTDLIGGWVDKMVWFFGGETVKNEYIRQMNLIKKQANEERKKLLKAIANKQINQPTVAPLLTRLNTIAKQELEDTSFLQATKNTEVVQAGKNVISGVQWEINGVANSTVSIITWAFDLLTFLGKYSVSYLGYHPEYKDKVNTQAQQLYEYLKKEGMWEVKEKAVTLFNQEIERISKLPQEQQAKAIGNITGNIIGMLLVMKAGTVAVEKIGKISKQTKRGEILLAREISKDTPNLVRTQKLEWLLKSADQTKKTLTIANIALNGVAESIIWAALAKQLEFTLWFFENKNISVDGKIKLLRETLSDLDNKYRTETDETKKQEILQVIEAYKNHASVQKIVKYQQRRDAILERAFQRSAEMFHIGEDILRKNPDIDWTGLAQQIEDHFIKQGAQLSKDQKEMLAITATSLEKAKQKRQIQLEEIFQRAGVNIPKKLEDIEHIMNTNSNIQFEEWKNYSVERWSIDYLNTVLARNEDATLKIMEKEWLHGDIQNLTQTQKEQLAWHLEWWITAIKFNLTSHPTCIIHQFREASAYINSKSVGHISLWTWKIYVRGDYPEKDIHDTIEHEYQHFLHLSFLDPIEKQTFEKAAYSNDHDYLSLMKKWWKHDISSVRQSQWETMKNEIASYLERDGGLPARIEGYLSSTWNNWELSNIYGTNIDDVIALENVLKELLTHKIPKQEIVDIVRTSRGFEHVYERFQKKYGHIIDFPMSISYWKSWNIDTIIDNLNTYKQYTRTMEHNSSILFKKEDTWITGDYKRKIWNVYVTFHLRMDSLDPIEVKRYIEDIDAEIIFLSEKSSHMNNAEVTLKIFMERFWSASLGGNWWYIDENFILHSPQLGPVSLSENRNLLESIFPKENDV